jgi:hypothetical protein
VVFILLNNDADNDLVVFLQPVGVIFRVTVDQSFVERARVCGCLADIVMLRNEVVRRGCLNRRRCLRFGWVKRTVGRLSRALGV